MSGMQVQGGVGGAMSVSGVSCTQRGAVAGLATERSAEHGFGHGGALGLPRFSAQGLASAQRACRALIRLPAAHRAAAAGGSQLLRRINNAWQANMLLQRAGSAASRAVTRWPAAEQQAVSLSGRAGK